jgi:hypothetical protein
MRKRLAAVSVGLVTAALIWTFPTASGDATSGVDLGITGSTVAGVHSAQQGQELGFGFTVTNHSTTRSADLAVTFTVTHGAANISDYICPLISNHFDINPDGSSCEIGSLAHGKSTGVAILVAATGAGTMTVKACASNLAGTTDPTPSNNCKTLSVPVSYFDLKKSARGGP